MPIHLYSWLGTGHPTGNLTLFSGNFRDRLQDITHVQHHWNKWGSKAEPLWVLWIAKTVWRWRSRRGHRGPEKQYWPILSWYCWGWVIKLAGKQEKPRKRQEALEQVKHKEQNWWIGARYAWRYFLWIRCEPPWREPCKRCSRGLYNSGGRLAVQGQMGQTCLWGEIDGCCLF